MTVSLDVYRVRLPVGLLGEDLVALTDELKQRVHAVVRPAAKGRRKPEAEPSPLPEGVKPVPRLPEIFSGAWGRFLQASDVVRAIYDGRARAATALAATDGALDRGAANEACDGSFRALEPWLDGLRQLRDDGAEPTAADAAWLYDAIFPAPDGLRFINFQPRRQWAAMAPKMKLLAETRAQSILTGFGGQRLYKQLVHSHEQFGRAFGFLQVVVDAAGPDTDSRPELLAAKDALRDLVGKIAAYAEPTVPGSEAMSQFLLGPFTKLVSELDQSSARAKKAPAAPTPAAPSLAAPAPAAPNGA